VFLTGVARPESGTAWTHHAQSDRPDLALAALLTGRYPSEIARLAAFSIPPDAPTLPKLLKTRGYATAGFVSQPAIDARHGFARGFDTFGSADTPVEDIAAWVHARRGKPVLLVLGRAESLEALGLASSTTLQVVRSPGTELGAGGTLALRGPGICAPASLPSGSQDVDVLPTVMGILGASARPGRGLDLSPWLHPGESAEVGTPPIYLESPRRAMLVEGGVTAVVDGVPGTEGMLRAISARDDLPEAVRERLLSITRACVAATTSSSGPRIGDDLKETLREHGYWSP
jgi:hypothetical protein